PDCHPDLARGRAGQELAQRHQIGIGLVIEPFAAHHELVTEIAEMRDRAAERGQAKSQKDAEDFPGGATLLCCCRSARRHGSPWTGDRHRVGLGSPSTTWSPFVALP